MSDFTGLLWMAAALTLPPFVVGAVAAVYAMRAPASDESDSPSSH